MVCVLSEVNFFGSRPICQAFAFLCPIVSQAVLRCAEGAAIIERDRYQSSARQPCAALRVLGLSIYIARFRIACVRSRSSLKPMQRYNLFCIIPNVFPIFFCFLTFFYLLKHSFTNGKIMI